MSGPRVLVAPDSFGGWRSAADIAALVAAQLSRRGCTVAECPLSDGGEGLLQVLLAHGQLERISGQEVDGRVVWQGRGAQGVAIETARLFGLDPDALQPWSASSAPLAAALRGSASGWIGLGGTACFDLGLGFLGAWGLDIRDDGGQRLPGPLAARHLAHLGAIAGPPPDLSAWTVLADVSTSLDQAAARFGPQKGFVGEDLDELEEGVALARAVIDEWLRRNDRPVLDAAAFGAGAAGGLGALLRALGAEIRSGAGWAVDALLSPAVARFRPDAVVTGEGRIDASTADHKLVAAVLRWCNERDIPCHVVAGAGAQAGVLHRARSVHIGGAARPERREAALRRAVDRLHVSLS